jgi:hypothetical protein
MFFSLLQAKNNIFVKKENNMSKSDTNYYTQVPEKLFHEIGGDASMFLMKIQYWLSFCGRKVKGENGFWIYNSALAWQKQFQCFSLYKIKKIIATLKAKEFLIVKKVNAKKYNQTNWYSLNLTKLAPYLDLKKFEQKKAHRLVEIDPMKNKETIYTKKSSSKEEQEISNVVLKEKKQKPKEQISPEMQTIAQEMVSVWNEEMQFALSPIKGYVSAATSKQLYALWLTIFNQDMSAWRDFALKVNSSKFLMGEKQTKSDFKASFLWLLQENTALKILGGEYGVGDRTVDKENLEQNIELRKTEIVAIAEKKIAQVAQEDLCKTTELKNFKQYAQSQQFLFDGDVYGLSSLFKLCSLSRMLEPQNQEILNYAFERFLKHKHYKLQVNLAKDRLVQLLETTTEHLGSRRQAFFELSHIAEKVRAIDPLLVASETLDTLLAPRAELNLLPP